MRGALNGWCIAFAGCCAVVPVAALWAAGSCGGVAAGGGVGAAAASCGAVGCAVVAARTVPAARGAAHQGHAAAMRVFAAVATALSALTRAPARAGAAKAWSSAVALVLSVPRTVRMFKWALSAVMAYKALQSRWNNHQSEEYQDALSELHKVQAARLTRVARANGGVYVKFGQFAVTFGAIPREYRTALAQLEDKAMPRPFREVAPVLLSELSGVGVATHTGISGNKGDNRSSSGSGSGSRSNSGGIRAAGSAAAVAANARSRNAPAVAAACNGCSTCDICDGLSSLVGPPGSGAPFVEFERHATAAASLAQVHRARLACGSEVAVKLQYPGLRASLAADLATLFWLASLAARAFPRASLVWLFHELKVKLEVELDFRNEVANADRLRELLASRRKRYLAAVPELYNQLCTERVIVMEWVQGIKITDTSELRRRDISPHAVGMAMVRAFAEMAFVEGYVHADPHPGNIMVRASRRGRSWVNWLLCGSRRHFEVVLLDHGAYLDLQPETRELFCQLWCAFAARDRAAQAELSTAVAGGNEHTGRVLPVLLMHNAKSRREEEALQRSVGVRGFSDFATLLSTAPHDVVELLRINSVVKATSNALGVTQDERRRVFAWSARRGLPRLRTRACAAPHMRAPARTRRYRMRLWLLLAGWSAVAWARGVARRAARGVVGALADLLFE